MREYDYDQMRPARDSYVRAFLDLYMSDAQATRQEDELRERVDLALMRVEDEIARDYGDSESECADQYTAMT